MKLTKKNVCVYIKDEAQLEEMREFLESKGEKIADDGTFCLLDESEYSYLQFFGYDNTWFLGLNHSLNAITHDQFKSLFK